MSYNSKRTGAEVETLLNKAETALQSVPSEYVTEGVLNEGLKGKVDKVSGKQLSTEDFTTDLKTKLEEMDAYRKPDGGIPKSDMDINVQVSLDKGEAAWQFTTYSQIPDNRLEYSSSGCGDISPIDIAISNVHSANRLALCNTDGVTVEYSNDSGSTWNDYNASNEMITGILSGCNPGNFALYIGKREAGEKATVDDQLRITLDPNVMNIYTHAQKMLLNISVDGATQCKLKVDYEFGDNPGVFAEQGVYDINGWSGWNAFPCNCAFGSVHVTKMRLTFFIGGVDPTYDSRLHLIDMYLVGKTYWIAPSTMAKTGHLYDYDYNKNAYFPGEIYSNGDKTLTAQDITGKQDTIADLETIREGAAKGATALQRIDYPQLEDNLIDSGFYHSPDGMLYRSDMEDAVLESLDKADSALQAENDPIFSASPAASITTERMQEWDNKAGKVVNHASSDTNVELTPYVTHKWGIISSLTLTFSESTESEYNVVFEANDADFVLSIPQNIRWANSQIPQFEAKKQYEINIKGERALYAVFDAPYIEGTFLEYIENDGVDYILTDIYITESMSGMRCKSMILTTPSSNVALAGTRNTSSGTDTAPFIMWYLTTGRYLYWNGVRISGFGSFEPNVAYTDEHSGDAVSLDCSYPIAIFGVNNQGRVQSGSVFRLYYLELLDSNGNPIVNLCPFKRTYDNAIGLLDKVSGTFYPSNNGNLIGG